MANVIKHKRGSGSDPVANDLVVGEVAIRTDTGKLFTKMDNGSVAEIAGGGSDIAINTLSSSSGAGGGSATFNGSAYRFTLSQPPSVSAYQLLVSINGVIQKPVSGTGQPSEGFAVDGTDIILGDAPETGADFFILTFKSLGVSEPADNSVTSAKIVDGAIVNADVNASAAIAGTKISPDFGSQNIVTTGKVGINETALSSFNSIADDLIISQASGSAGITIRSGTGNTGVLAFTDGANTNFRGDLRYDHNGDYMRFSTDGDERMRIDSSGRLVIGTTAASSAGNSQYSLFEVSGNTSGATGPGHLSIKRGTASASLSNGDTIGRLIFSGLDGGDFAFIQASVDADNTTDFPGRLMFYTCADGATSATERMRIDSSGNVGIGENSPDEILHLKAANPVLEIEGTAASSGDTGVFLNANGNHWFLRADNYGSQNGFSIKSGTPSSSTHRLLIDSSGNVGINDTSPTAELSVAATAPHIDIGAAGGTRMKIGYEGNNCFFGATSDTGMFIFKQDVDAEGHPQASGTERMRISSAGSLLVGCTATPSASVAGTAFISESSGRRTGFMSSSSTSEMFLFQFFNPNGGVGSIRTNGSATSFVTSSDYRLKENATAMSDGITRLKTLKPYRFNFKADADTTLDGFFAHEVQLVVPEAISGTKDEVDSDNNPVYQGIDQSKLVPLLVAALQEAIGRIEALEAK